MIDLNLYHWFLYLLGFIFCPQLTIMIFISIYFKNYLPFPLFFIGWILAILSLFGGSKVVKSKEQ